MQDVSVRFPGLCLVFLLISNGLAYSQNLSSSARNLALAGAAQTGSIDAFSVVDQPAGISSLDKAKVGFSYLQHHFKLDNSIPHGNAAAWDSAEGLVQNPQSSSDLTQAKQVSLGLILPVIRNVNFGLTASLPGDRLASIYAYSSNDPQYLLYSSRAAKPEIHTALSARLPFGLSVGFGLYYSLKATGHVQIAASAQKMESRLQLDLKPEYLPYGGLQWMSQNEAGPVYFADFTYKAPQSSRSRLDVDLLIQTEDLSLPLNLGAELIPYFDPETFKLAFGTETQNFNLYASAIYRRWSKYRPPVVDVYGNDDPGAGLDDLNAGDLGLQDARSYHIGLEVPLKQLLQTNEEHFARLGSSYQEAATMKSARRLLLLDTDKFTASLGYGITLPAGTLTAQALDLALGIQKTWLFHSSFREESSSGRLAQAGGQIWTAQAGVQYAF